MNNTIVNQNIEDLLFKNETFKKQVKKGILKGLADVEAGRVTELNQEFAEQLKARLKERLADKQIKTK